MNSIVTSFLTIHGVVSYITLTSTAGTSVTLSSLGAGIVSVCVPDSSGKIDDIALGYDNAEDYYNDGPAMGKIPGRYANRIKFGKFTIDGKEYQLPTNQAPHTLHGGGEIGTHNKNWTVEEVTDSSVRFTLVSPDGDAGFPGMLKLSATYYWTEDNTLSLRIEAETDKPTVINFTNHAYFNLKGTNGGTALDHILKLNADGFLETDSMLVPTGKILPVEGTPMDFREPKTVGKDINADYQPLKFGKGYDHCFAVKDYVPGVVRQIAVLAEPTSGRIVEILSDQPGVQLYTANWMDGAPLGKKGYRYSDYDGIALEAQDFPDAPNHPGFPSTQLNPGEKYCRNIVFRFKSR